MRIEIEPPQVTVPHTMAARLEFSTAVAESSHFLRAQDTGEKKRPGV
jgi:hypothetical protein